MDILINIDELQESDGLFYQRSSNTPFSGGVTGKEKGTFNDGKREGHWVTFYDNGQLRNKGNYKDGKKEGLWVHYSRDGSVLNQGED